MNKKSILAAALSLPLLFLQGGGVAFASTSAAKPKFNPYVYNSVATDERVNAAVATIDKLAQKHVEDKVVPGMAISIVHKGKVIFAKGYGVRDTKKNEKVDADTVFQLASVSKPLASTVVAELVGEGKITWDTKILDLDPGFAMYVPWVTSQITVRDLFAHRSGLPDHALDLLEDMGYDREHILYQIRFQRTDSSFRSAYAYTNFGLTEAACAAAKGYGLNWEDACDQKLYKPLEMTSTSSRYADFIQRPNHAVNHVLVNGNWEPRFQRQPDAQSPAGGASSSANDMTKWMLLQLGAGKFEGKQIVASEPLDETHKPCMLTQIDPINGLPQFYGLGFNVSHDVGGRLRLSHSGGFACGEATVISLLPDEDLGICVLTNASPIGEAEGLSSTFMDLALYGKTTQDWFAIFKAVFADPATLGLNPEGEYKTAPANPSPALANSAYVGKYTNELYGNVEIVERGGGLVLELGPKRMQFPMKHFDRDVFTFDPHTENFSGPCGLRIGIDAQGKAIGVFIEPLNENGQGWFERVHPKP